VPARCRGARGGGFLVTNPRTCLIDASTAHRTQAGWVYGLPELARGQREALRASKRIANPGCHATAFILLMRPLVDAGLVPSGDAGERHSITGYSGGGKKMIEQYQAGGDPALEAPRPYGLTLAHKHLPEMAAHTGLTQVPPFMPVVGNFYKGLAVTVPLHLSQLPAGHHAAAPARRAGGALRGRALRARDAAGRPGDAGGGFFDVQACNDSNRADILVFANDSQVLLACRLDNLGKGASGAAVQCMNLHLGVDESLGL
jgi:N-acetyl-gamma-glutamyl-phosphate reductase